MAREYHCQIRPWASRGCSAWVFWARKQTAHRFFIGWQIRKLWLCVAHVLWKWAQVGLKFAFSSFRTRHFFFVFACLRNRCQGEVWWFFCQCDISMSHKPQNRSRVICHCSEILLLSKASCSNWTWGGKGVACNVQPVSRRSSSLDDFFQCPIGSDLVLMYIFF